MLQVKNIEKIELGRFEMETWYFSPFPPEYRECKVGRLSKGLILFGPGWQSAGALLLYL
jgi:hypothetical protein